MAFLLLSQITSLKPILSLIHSLNISAGLPDGSPTEAFHVAFTLRGPHTGDGVNEARRLGLNQTKTLLRRRKQLPTVAIEAGRVCIAHNNPDDCLFLPVLGSIACRK